MAEVSLEDLVSLCKRRGFIYQGSEIYGGLAGTYDYGPLGALLKRNIINAWLKYFVDGWDDMYQIDSSILMNPKVWQASGHVDTFTDPMIECTNCHTRFRADRFPDKPPISSTDKLWTEKWVDSYRAIKGMSDQNDLSKASDATLKSFIEKKVVCPNCNKFSDFGEPRQFNMMFETVAGATASLISDEEGSVLTDEQGIPLADEKSGKSTLLYLRPETAQGMFTDFKNIVDTFSPDLPFGIAQVGKAFRNEISPRDFLFRTREFEIMEFEFFVHESQWEEKFEKWRKDMHAWFKVLGFPEDKIKEIEVPEDDRAHYSKRTIDFEFNYPSLGFAEIAGLAYRTDFDLKNHQEKSGKNMEYRPKDGGKPFIPHVIEPTFGVDRHVLAVLSNAFSEDEQGGEKRIFLKLPADLAPYKVAICPLAKNKPELVEKAREIYKSLKKEVGNVFWVDTGNIGKNYRRADEIGVPKFITVDFQTLEDDSVTIRDRDTTKQNRFKIDGLLKSLSVSDS